MFVQIKLFVVWVKPKRSRDICVVPVWVHMCARKGAPSLFCAVIIIIRHTHDVRRTLSLFYSTIITPSSSPD
jgi:hypothetical protein